MLIKNGAGCSLKASFSCTTTRGPIPRLAQMFYSNSSTGRFSTTPYSPDLAPSDYHLFTKMKVWLATRCFHANEELMDGVNNWLHNLAVPSFEEGLYKLVSRYDKCLNVDGNHVEK